MIRLAGVLIPSDGIADFFESPQQDSGQASVPTFERRVDMLQIASDFNIHGSGFLERQDLCREDTSVACHEETDNAGNRGIRSDSASEEFHGQDACRNGCIRRSRQKAYKADGGECRPIESQHIPEKASRCRPDEQNRHDQPPAAPEIQGNAGENRFHKKGVKNDSFPPQRRLYGFETAPEKLLREDQRQANQGHPAGESLQ